MNTDTLSDLKMKLAMTPDLVFYTTVLYGLETYFGDTPSNTAHVSGNEMVFNKAFFNALNPDERMGLMLHEVRHITDLHEFRRKGRDPMLWNAACDFAINIDLVDSGFTLPFQNSGNICLDTAYRDMSAEDIYDALLKDSPDKQPDTPDLPETSSEGNGKGDDGNSSSQASGELKEEIKDLLIQAVKMAERKGSTAAGKVPAHIRRQVEEWLNPVLPWYTVLQRYMSTFKKDDYNWARPNRRYLPNKIYLPVQKSEQLGPIHIFIDASCSVSEERFSMQANQVRWIKYNLNPSELRIIVFNTKIVDTFIFKEYEPMNVTFKGHGGTCVREVVKYMEDNPAECNLIFTDGYFHKHDLSEVKTDVICCIYDNSSFNWDRAKTIYI